MRTSKLRLALLISGGGSTAQAILRAVKSGRLRGIEPALLLASKAEAGGIDKALKEGMRREEVVVCRPRDYPSPEAFGEALLGECRRRIIDLIGQYGWLPKTPPNLIEAYSRRMTNQHPGPIDPGRPDFGGQGMYGRRVHCAVLRFARAVKRPFWTEATAQRVAAEYDRGAVLRRRVVEIKEDDTVESLQARVLPEEHFNQIKVLEDFANDRVREFIREEPLIRAGEEEILKQAKKAAQIEFPHG